MPSGFCCEANKAQGVRCANRGDFMSRDTTQPPRIVCADHQGNAPYGYTSAPLDIDALPQVLLSPYLARLEGFRTYCDGQCQRYHAWKRQAELAAGAVRRALALLYG